MAGQLLCEALEGPHTCGIAVSLILASRWGSDGIDERKAPTGHREQAVGTEGTPGEQDSRMQDAPGEESEKEKDRGLPGFEPGFAAISLLLAAALKGKKRT